MTKSNNKLELEMKSIGDWQLDRTLGVGCYGTVRLAYHKDYRFAAAIKIISKQILERPTAMDRLNMEIDSLRRLSSHPKILHLFEVIETDAHIALVTEHIGGGDLLAFVQSKGRLEEAEARPLFRQCVEAMLFAHDQHIVHRDLKAENIFLTSDKKEIRIGDWGFATPWAPGRRMKERYGSIHYAAPEIFLGREYTGPEVDVWSLGVLLFGLVGGRFPFRGRTDVEIADNTVLGNYKMPSFLSRPCAHLLQSVLQTDPRRRCTLRELRSHPWLKEEAPCKPLLEEYSSCSSNVSSASTSSSLGSPQESSSPQMKSPQTKKKKFFGKNHAQNVASSDSFEDDCTSPCISPPLECCSPCISTTTLQEVSIHDTDACASQPMSPSVDASPVASDNIESPVPVTAPAPVPAQEEVPTSVPSEASSATQQPTSSIARPPMKRRISRSNLSLLQRVKEMLFARKLSSEGLNAQLQAQQQQNPSPPNPLTPQQVQQQQQQQQLLLAQQQKLGLQPFSNPGSPGIVESPLHKKQKMPATSPEFKKSCVSDKNLLLKWTPTPIHCAEPSRMAPFFLGAQPPKIRASS